MSDFMVDKLANDNDIIKYDGKLGLLLTANGTSNGSNVNLKTYTIDHAGVGND